MMKKNYLRREKTFFDFLSLDDNRLEFREVCMDEGKAR